MILFQKREISSPLFEILIKTPAYHTGSLTLPGELSLNQPRHQEPLSPAVSAWISHLKLWLLLLYIPDLQKIHRSRHSSPNVGIHHKFLTSSSSSFNPWSNPADPPNILSLYPPTLQFRLSRFCQRPSSLTFTLPFSNPPSLCLPRIVFLKALNWSCYFCFKPFTRGFKPGLLHRIKPKRLQTPLHIQSPPMCQVSPLAVHPSPKPVPKPASSCPGAFIVVVRFALTSPTSYSCHLSTYWSTAHLSRCSSSLPPEVCPDDTSPGDLNWVSLWFYILNHPYRCHPNVFVYILALAP